VSVGQVPQSSTEPFPVLGFVLFKDVIFAANKDDVKRREGDLLDVLVGRQLFFSFKEPFVRFLYTFRDSTSSRPIFY
jgi:hypothetical protein